MNEFLSYFNKKIEEKKIKLDSEQIKVVHALNDLLLNIIEYLKKKKGFFALFSKIFPPKGIYLWGKVGRGKSMLLNVFYESLPTDRKRKFHFHEFMLMLHQKMHQFKQNKKYKNKNILNAVLDEIIKKIDLIYIDEFEVIDIADAMILERIIKIFINNKIIIIFSSNKKPANLYEQGLQREHFLNCIKLISSSLNIMECASKQDYRAKFSANPSKYFCPITNDINSFIKNLWKDKVIVKNSIIHIGKRTLQCQCLGEDIIEFTFEQLCERPLSSKDYIFIAKNFYTIIITKIPKLLIEDKNEARRFINLVDALYQARTNLYITADVSIDELYDKGDWSEEFKRTGSRLKELQFLTN